MRTLMRDRTFLGIVALAVLVLVAMVVYAGTAKAQAPLETAQIEWADQTPKLERDSTTYKGVRFDIVGQFLNYQMEGEDLQYARVPQGATGLAIYPDGSVTFTGVLALAAAEPDKNDPAYWGENCEKIDSYEGGNTWVSPGGYTLVVLKSGTTNWIFESVTTGQILETPDGRDISHLIVCPPGETTTTTVPPTTTTTQRVTTTTVEQSTTTTTPPASSTTTQETSTTTTETTIPTTSTEETTTSETPTELPHTGPANLALVALGASGLIALGVATLRKVG